MSVTKNKLIIVSNRLPVSVKKVNGKLVFKESTGGLATGLSSVAKDIDCIWVGWPGINTEQLTIVDRQVIKNRLKKEGFHPIFLSKKQIENYYSGYSNGTLWPLLHYTHEQSEYHDYFWKMYQKVNELFCEEIVKIANKNSAIWVHDYHLFLLPDMLRQKLSSAQIGFFLHTPFPSFELFRLLPEREAIIKGLLGSNLIGFHTYDYARHFMRSVLRLVGYENEAGDITVDNRKVHTGVFPIGIDYQKYAKGNKKFKVKQKLASIPPFGKNKKIILSCDRADYSKGIPEKLDAFEYFLENNPEFHTKVILLLTVSPSRVDVEAYQHLQSEIDLRISKINGKFSVIGWSPISYLYRDLSFNDVISAYCLSDIMLVTPLRDGMNLMAKEYVATKQDGKGVLVLSEMTGAASELLEAIQVNPNNKKMVANSIKKALLMPTKEQKARLKAMQARVSTYTVQRWAKDFLSTLDKIATTTDGYAEYLSTDHRKKLISDYKKAKKRILLLDYDGTLKSFVDSHETKAGAPSNLIINVLRRLSKVKNSKAVIISGRPKSALINWFSKINIDLIAEHGGWIRNLQTWVKTSSYKTKWRKEILPILKEYTERTPGSFVEKKTFSIVWHYRKVTPDLAFVRLAELKKDLKIALNGYTDSIGIFDGQKIVEIKPLKLNKGEITRNLVDSQNYDFILAIGDDYTDEDMFKSLPKSSYTIKVGTGPTSARFYVSSVRDSQNLIDEISKN
jgi:trehalose 6-phosphate synthase/phosphatase